ncbi:MAG: cbb3-type cytochrome c oxidase subunit 3 [Betaproteobacteria bacterium]|nr:cbb3-type cytochrome c oxidase subunit 3 [Betaproteobacteria bacterium]
MDINDLRSVVTVVSFVMFIGIVWWAYSDKRKPAFDEAALLPFSDDELAEAGKEAGQRERKAS